MLLLGVIMYTVFIEWDGRTSYSRIPVTLVTVVGCNNIAVCACISCISIVARIELSTTSELVLLKQSLYSTP